MQAAQRALSEFLLSQRKPQQQQQAGAAGRGGSSRTSRRKGGEHACMHGSPPTHWHTCCLGTAWPFMCSGACSTGLSTPCCVNVDVLAADWVMALICPCATGTAAAGSQGGASGKENGASSGASSSSRAGASSQPASTSSLSAAVGARAQRRSSGSGEFYDASEEGGVVAGNGSGSRGSGTTAELRPLGLEDFREVLRTMRPSTAKAEEYSRVGRGGWWWSSCG